MDSKVSEAYSLQGYLEKKSPAMFKGYQKRYFAVRDNGDFLFYYKAKPKSGDAKPQGIVPLRSIESIAIVKGSQTEFILVIPERQMQLKCESSTEREKWIKTLEFIKEWKAKEDAQSGPDAMKSSAQLKKKVGWSDLGKDTMARIKLEDEKEQYRKLSNKMDIKNDEVMKCKGIYPYIQKFDGRTQDQYIICGFLLKKGKLAKVTVAKRRWFIMIASVPINGEPVEKPGPTQNDIPDTFQLDTIYYFKYNERGDKSNFIDKIPAEEIDSIELMDLDKNQFFESLKVQKLPYGFSFMYKERTYNFFSEHLTEIDKWIRAINAVRNAPKDTKMKQSQQAEVKEEVVFEGPLDKKHQNKLLTGPLSWKQMTVMLKKNSLSWNGENDEQGNQYVLLIYIKEVVGKNRSFQVFTTDGEEYKFRAGTPELREKWCKAIQDQVAAIKQNMGDLDLALELPPEQNEDQAEPEIREEDLEDEETITAKFYKKMVLSIDQSASKEEKVKKQGFFSKLFCCYGGGEQEIDVEKDRGF